MPRIRIRKAERAAPPAPTPRTGCGPGARLSAARARERLLAHLQILAAEPAPPELDTSDCTAVFEAFGTMVYRLALTELRQREDAEDCCQEVFLRYVREAARIASPEHCRAWLIRVTINCCRDLFRSPARRLSGELSEAVEAGLGAEDPGYAEIESDAALAAALAALTAEEARCVHLFYHERYSVKEIAALCGDSAGAVKVRLHRARKKLKDYWT